MANPVSETTPAAKQPRPPELRGKLTRSQVATRLGVSVSKVRTMEGTMLHPEVINGVHYFGSTDVDALAQSLPVSKRSRARLDEGQIAARVFYLIEHGKELNEIVQELEVPPQLVRTLYHEWKTDFMDGEEERRRAADEAVEERQVRQLERDADRHSRDLDRMMRGFDRK
jgi:hypothetical protein